MSDWQRSCFCLLVCSRSRLAAISVSMSPFASEVAAARLAQQPWSRLSVRERLRPVRRLRALLVERADDLIAAVHADIAARRSRCSASELLATAAALKFLEQAGRAAARAAKRLAGGSGRLAHGLSRRGPPPPVGRRRHHRHLELPDLPERGAGRAGARRGQRGGVETERERPANGRPDARALPRSRLPARAVPEAPRDARGRPAAGRGGQSITSSSPARTRSAGSSRRGSASGSSPRRWNSPAATRCSCSPMRTWKWPRGPRGSA